MLHSLDPMHPTSVLTKILDEISTNESGLRSLVVFDLDSTLYDLTLRVTAIIENFAEQEVNRERWPTLCKRLESVEIRRNDWGLTEPLQRIGVTKENEPEFVHALMSHWSQGFFSNSYLDRDFPLPGAVDFVVQCLSHGADVMYLTGRDVQRMQDGTAQSLMAQGFPLDQTRAVLVLKPVAGLDDAEFKADVLAPLADRYQSIWLFENEPVNINRVIAKVPKVKVVFIDTCHSGLESVHESIDRIAHFEIARKDMR